MADDRQLRDELEKVQSEVARLRKASGQHSDVRARIDALRRSKAQQQAKLDEVAAEVARLEEELRGVMEKNDGLQAELDALLTSERGLVDRAVRSLDPGPRTAGGCLTVLALVLGVVLAGACG